MTEQEHEDVRVARLTRQFHEAYERLAPEFGYRTREESAVPWEQVPAANRALMYETVAKVMGPLLEQLRQAEANAALMLSKNGLLRSENRTLAEQIEKERQEHEAWRARITEEVKAERKQAERDKAEFGATMDAAAGHYGEVIHALEAALRAVKLAVEPLFDNDGNLDCSQNQARRALTRVRDTLDALPPSSGDRPTELGQVPDASGQTYYDEATVPVTGESEPEGMDLKRSARTDNPAGPVTPSENPTWESEPEWCPACGRCWRGVAPKHEWKCTDPWHGESEPERCPNVGCHSNPSGEAYFVFDAYGDPTLCQWEGHRPARLRPGHTGEEN